jgi:hypothetical protein
MYIGSWPGITWLQRVSKMIIYRSSIYSLFKGDGCFIRSKFCTWSVSNKKVHIGHTEQFIENKNIIIESKWFQKIIYFSHIYSEIHDFKKDLNSMVPKEIKQTSIPNPKFIFKKRK